MISTNNIFMQIQLYSLNISDVSEIQQYIENTANSETVENTVEVDIIDNTVEGA